MSEETMAERTVTADAVTDETGKSGTRTSARDTLHHIVIVGGGAAGLELATGLGDKLGKRRKADITLIERSRTHLWKPLLHEVAAGSMNRNDRTAGLSKVRTIQESRGRAIRLSRAAPAARGPATF